MTRYELLERIGAGGMAEIFRGKAVAAGGFEKPVAIKRILPHLSQDQRFVQLLIAEANILSKLRHRNIVQIFDVGLGDDSQYFLVMEFVDGMDLGNVQRGLETRRKRLPLDLVLHIGAEVCDALQHAHGAPAPDGQPMRLVHRDVSPSNVLISRSGEVKLTDFGIAKRPEEQTGQHGVRGKFAYISPEQAENGHVDARSDVFSVGVLLFELALGHRLFSQLSDMDALHAVRTGTIPSPREIDPGLPAEVETILRSALARDPMKRMASAGELGASLRGVRYSLETTAGDPATELARIVASLQVSAREAPDPKKARPQGKRRRAPSSGFELAEPTVVRIKTAADFSVIDGDSTSILRARQVLDRFEEEETRFARSRRGPFPTDEVTLSGKPQGPLEMSDSGGLGDEETRVMSQALARRMLAADDESTQTVTQRRPGAEVAAAIAAAIQPSAPPPPPGPSPTLGAAASPPPPAPLLRAAMAGGPAGRGSTSISRPGRTPLPEPNPAARVEPAAAGGSPPRGASGSRVEPSVSERLSASTEREVVDRREPPRSRAMPAATAAPTAAKSASWLASRAHRRWLLAIAAVAVATASFLAASAVLGGGDKDRNRGVVPPLPSAVPVESGPPVDPAATPDKAGAPTEPGQVPGSDQGAGTGAKDGAAKASDTATREKPAAKAKPAASKPAVKAPAKAGGGKAKPTKKTTEKKRTR